jgi:hypothetical protein
MHGESLEPKKTAFALYEQDNSHDFEVEGPLQIFLVDLEDVENDDVRDVIHPEFDVFWDNICENTFEPVEDVKDALDTPEKARKWLKKIGMVEWTHEQVMERDPSDNIPSEDTLEANH